MHDEYVFLKATAPTGGARVARGPNSFRVECDDPSGVRRLLDDTTMGKNRGEGPWRPIGQIRREDMHRMFDEWLDSLGRC